MVSDNNAGEELGVAHTPKYTGAIVKLLQWRQWGSVNPVYGMVKVELWPITIGKNPRFLIGERIYSGTYYWGGICNPGIIATHIILVCQ